MVKNSVQLTGPRWNLGGPVHFSNPSEILIAYEPDDIRSVLLAVQERVDAGHYAAGFVSYEAAPGFDPALVVKSSRRFPLVWFGIYVEPSIFEIDSEDDFIDNELEWRMEGDEASYLSEVDRLHESIGDGDFYQVNLTRRFRSQSVVSPQRLSTQFLVAQPNAFHASIEFEQGHIISASPELFFEVKDRLIKMKPMKGTSTRGLYPSQDQAVAERLALSEKDRAENLMIVDLVRNDIGRIAKPGTVSVSEMFEIEKHPSVWQMTSTVHAELQDAVGIFEIFEAMFPCGSVTGAPKVAAMAKIAEMELSPRLAYCGAIGWLAPSGIATFSVAIRTAILDTSGLAEYGAGGGITWDSVPEFEYNELVSKTAILCGRPEPVELLETLLLDNGQYTLLSRHMYRLRKSSEYFDLPLNLNDVMEALEKVAKEANDSAYRVRLTVSAIGINVTYQPYSASKLKQKIVLGLTPVDKNCPWLYHKTTNRKAYESHLADFTESFDVLLWNSDEELTEFTFGNVALEIDGTMYTPPVSSGLLAGCLRAELLGSGILVERVCHIADLKRAARIYFLNSVRGMFEVFLSVNESNA